MPVTNSPNMNLPVPSVGTTPGPDYATDVNACLTLIDQHNHSAGSGVQITNDGINITDAFTLNSNFLIDANGMTMIAQGSTPANQTVYTSGVDLYYVDGSGNNIRLTASGSIAGATGSIAGLASPASATYVSVSQTFVWQSGASIAANMDCGSILMRNLSPNSTYALTLSPPAALAANYSLVLPPLPASQKIMTLDASGNITAPYSVDGSTITISSNVIGVPNGGITSAKLATGAAIGNLAAGSITQTYLASNSVGTAQVIDGNITPVKRSTSVSGVSSSSGAFSGGIAGLTDITNLSVTLSLSGRPVKITLISDGSANTSLLDAAGAGSANAFLRLLRDSTGIADFIPAYEVAGSRFIWNPVTWYDASPGTGSITYKLQYTAGAGGAPLNVQYFRLLVEEL